MAGNKIFLRFDQHAVPAALGAYSIQTLLHAPASFLNKHHGQRLVEKRLVVTLAISGLRYQMLS